VPSCEIQRANFGGDGYPLIDALTATGLCQSKGEARRTIKEGGAYANNNRINDVEAKLTVNSLASESVVVLRRGKKKYALIRLV
jgi:tyrosyl-tRNA synthetase